MIPHHNHSTGFNEKKRFESKEQFFPPSMDDIISLSLYLSRPERLWFLNERPSTFYSFIPQCYYACVYMQIFHKILCILSLAPSLPPVRLSMSVDVSCSLSLLFVCLSAPDSPYGSNTIPSQVPKCDSDVDYNSTYFDDA